MPNKLISTKPAGIADNQCEVILWFFPGNSKAMLGHVACEITETENKETKKTHYYSLLTEPNTQSNAKIINQQNEEISHNMEEISRNMIDAEIGHYKTPNIVKTKFYTAKSFDDLHQLITVATREILKAAEKGSYKNNCAYYAQTILSIACPDKIPKPSKNLITTPTQVLNVAKNAGGENSILPNTQFVEGMLHNTINSIGNYLANQPKKYITQQQIVTERQCINAVKNSMLDLNQAIKTTSKYHSIKTNDQELHLADNELADKFVKFNNAVNKAERMIYENKTALKKQLGGLRYFFLELANLFLKDRRCELLHKFRNVVTLARKDLQKSFHFEFKKVATKPEETTEQQDLKEETSNRFTFGNIM